MAVTADGEILELRSRERSRTVRVGGELVTVPRQPEGQRRRLVWPTVERLYRSLAKKTGSSFATDFAVLAMVWKDMGHVFGDRSIARARRREAKRGTITSTRIKPNRKAGDKRTACGTVRVRFPDEAEKRAARWRQKVEARKRRRELAHKPDRERRARELVELRPHDLPGERARTDREQAAEQQDAKAHIRTALAALQLPKLAPPRERKERDAEGAHGVDVDARRAEVERQLAELAQLGFDLQPKKPPDE